MTASKRLAKVRVQALDETGDCNVCLKLGNRWSSQRGQKDSEDNPLPIAQWSYRTQKPAGFFLPALLLFRSVFYARNIRT